MLGDMFENEDDQEFNAAYGTLSSQTKPKNCAHFLEIPQQPRQEKNFIGLRNQGATCYLNSLIQALYMAPEFRNAILSIPLCEKDIKTPNPGMMSDTTEYDILLALQKLFAEMHEYDAVGASTLGLTNSFGWEDREVTVQHDIQEANRVLFDIISQGFALVDQNPIEKYYRGTTVNYLECLCCGMTKEKEESFLDLLLQIKDLTNVEEGLLNMVTLEKLEGSNQYECGVCNKKVDAYRGTKIRKFPPILTLSLNRCCEFDYIKGERKKVNTNFEFGLELDVSLFAENPQQYEKDGEGIYELFAVLIHGGSASSGHYHAYIRDTLDEGDWEKKMQMIKKAQEESKRKAEEQAEKDKEESSKKNKKNEEEDLDLKDHPIQFKNADLKKGWFDFNDSVVTPISHGRIQSQFGGNRENGYILVYRQKKLLEGSQGLGKKPLQDYLKKYIEELNSKLEKERIAYREAEQQLEMIVMQKEEINFEKREFVKKVNPTESGQKIKLGFENKLKDFYEKLGVNNANDTLFLEVSIQKNGLLFYSKILDFNDHAQMTIEELGIECWSIWIPFDRNDETFNKDIKPFVGEGWEPININIRNIKDSDSVLLYYQSKSFKGLREKIAEKYGIEYQNQLIFLLQGDEPKILNLKPEDDEKELKVLNIVNLTDLMVKELDPVEAEKQKKEALAKRKAEEQAEAQDDGLPGMGQFEQDVQNQLSENLTSVFAESDDHDVEKVYVNLDWTLFELLENLKLKLEIEADANRRLRNLTTKTLYYEPEMALTLREMGFEEGSTRIKVERGLIPQSGNICVTVKVQTQKLKNDQEKDLDLACDPTNTFLDLKKQICKELGVEPQDHRLYRCDWLGNPEQAYGEESKKIKDSTLKQGDIIAIRDRGSPIDSEMINVVIYTTKDTIVKDVTKIAQIKSQEDETIDQLKGEIIKLPEFEKAEVSHLRLGLLRKDEFLDHFIKGNGQKTLKKLGFKREVKIVVQVLDEPETLNENNMLLYIAMRDVENRTYEKPMQWVWEAPKDPTLMNLKTALIEFKKLHLEPKDIECAKYFNYKFQWHHIRPQEPKKEGDKATGKGGKGNQVDSLKKAPVLLKDGDLIGYRIENENPDKKDDFQTLEDQKNREEYNRKKREQEEAEKEEKKNRKKGKPVQEEAFTIKKKK